jgi:hypothetical protein
MLTTSYYERSETPQAICFRLESADPLPLYPGMLSLLSRVALIYYCKYK